MMIIQQAFSNGIAQQAEQEGGLGSGSRGSRVFVYMCLLLFYRCCFLFICCLLFCLFALPWRSGLPKLALLFVRPSSVSLGMCLCSLFLFLREPHAKRRASLKDSTRQDKKMDE